MASAPVGSGTYYNTAGGTGSVSYSPTLGNTLLVTTAAQTVGTGLTLSDGSNTYNYIGTTANAGGLYESMWWCHVTTGGSLSIGFGVSGIYGLFVDEWSGLATSPYISGSFQSQVQGGPGLGANAITTSSNPNVTTVPALLYGFSVNSGNALQGGNDPGPTAGTTLAYISRTVGWIGGAAQQSALAEYVRILSSGTNPITFSTTGNGQYDTFITIAAAFAESAPSSSAAIAWVT